MVNRPMYVPIIFHLNCTGVFSPSTEIPSQNKTFSLLFYSLFLINSSHSVFIFQSFLPLVMDSLLSLRPLYGHPLFCESVYMVCIQVGVMEGACMSNRMVDLVVATAAPMATTSIWTLCVIVKRSHR